MLKLWILYKYWIEVEIPSGTELHLLNLIYTEYAASETEKYQINSMRDKWQHNQLCLNCWQMERTVTI